MASIWFWRDGGFPWWGYAPLLWVPLEIIFGWLGWRDAGWALNDQVLMLRSRNAARSMLITPRRRIQYRATTANPLQRRVSLATLHVAVASGGLGGHYALQHLDATTCAELLLALKPRRAFISSR
jgi:putative membrane protein